jgi:hypothetical protein
MGREMFNLIKVLAIVCVVSATTFAKAPTVPGYRCVDELLDICRVWVKNLESARAHRAKPRTERMILTVGEGEGRFEGAVVNGPILVRELFGTGKTKPSGKISAEDQRVLSLLPDALRRRYARALDDRALASEKRRAARYLAVALSDIRTHIRRVAIDTLKALFGTDLAYRVDLPVAERRRIQAAWKRKIAKD